MEGDGVGHKKFMARLMLGNTCPILSMKKNSLLLLSILSCALLTISSASAQVARESDRIIITNPDGSINSLSQSIPETGEPLAFIAATTTVSIGGVPVPLFNITGGVTIWLEPGSNGGILPTDTVFNNDAINTLNAVLALVLGPSAKISDVFGVTTTLFDETSVIGFGLLSDNEAGLSVGSFGLPTGVQTLRFAFEPTGPEPVGNVFLTSVANTAGFGAAIQSDVPENGATISLLGLGLLGVAFLRGKLAFS